MITAKWFISPPPTTLIMEKKRKREKVSLLFILGDMTNLLFYR